MLEQRKMAEQPAAEPYIFSVQELTRYLKHLFDEDEILQDVWVRGEISNFTHHNSRHMYFTVKDETSRIRAVMFATHNQYLKFAPKNGSKVIIRGSVSVYERDGQYQLYVREMQPDGIGSLYLAFEQLKERLQAEGLFDAGRKRPLPPFPKVVGVITSPNGAAVRDIITTIKRRFPLADVLLFPVYVQGELAVPSIIRAFEIVNQRKDVDVVIVGRGGGSIEELWAFNEEKVARCIYHCRVPVISAVGHETDFTIADFVADVRAATPTAAAELAVPHLAEVKERLRHLRARLEHGLSQRVRTYRERLWRLQRSHAFRQPQSRLQQYQQRLDHLQDKLFRILQRKLADERNRLAQAANSLRLQSPLEKYRLAQERWRRADKHLLRNAVLRLEREEKRLQYYIGRLDALSPLKVMQRGYALVYDRRGKTVLTSAKAIVPGDAVKVRMKDGVLDCQVWGIEEESENGQEREI
ncbi:exodeoxyribonuclease VII large subunit [Bacillaceae bacterium]